MAWYRSSHFLARSVALVPLLALVCGGCSARFVDERDPAERQPLVLDLSLPRPDLAGVDLQGADLLEVDLGAPAGRTLAAGVFSGRAGHGGQGGGSLYQRADGQIEVRMAADFGVTGVVGPVVVLTTRQELGSMLRPMEGDLELGPLQKTAGAQSYLVPGGDGGRRVLFVWCKPFTVEIARAVLENQP